MTAINEAWVCRQRVRELHSVRIRCVETGEEWDTFTAWTKSRHINGRKTTRVLVYGDAHTDGLHYEKVEK